MQRNNINEKKDNWFNCLKYLHPWGWEGLVIDLAHYPYQYAYTLMQIGHEPVPPVLKMIKFCTLTKPVLKLPCATEYVAHIKSVDGLAGCWRGVVPAFAYQILHNVVYKIVYERVRSNTNVIVSAVVARAAAIIVSRPLKVVAIRTMAQFVGKETKYTGLFAGIRSVYAESGIFGYFYGIVPQLFGEMCAVALGLSAGYVFYCFIAKKERFLLNHALEFLLFEATFTLTYPLQVVATCVAISNSGLAAAKEPCMPLYTGWGDCFTHLCFTKQLNRGYKREYRGPYDVVDGSIHMKPSYYPKNLF